MTMNRIRNRAAAGLLALVVGGTLAACGDDSSTAQGSGSASNTPSVVVPANPTTSGKVETTTPNPHSGNGDAGDVDGAITEVTELPPASAVHDRTDEEFLADLKGQGIDVTDQILQDQVIAAAHEQCQANTEGRDSFSVPAVAGQLQALGVTDKDPEAVATAIKAAAEKHYCS